MNIWKGDSIHKKGKEIAVAMGIADREANPLCPVLMDAGELERFYYDVMEDNA